MRVFGVLLALFLSPTLAFGAGKVEVTTDATTYEGTDIKVTVTNATRGVIFLPNCGAVVLERFNGESYSPLPPPSCEGEVEPIRLKRGEARTYELSPEGEGRQLLRPVVSFATGCRSGVPLPQAECRDFGSVRSRYVSWAPAPKPETSP